MGIQKDHVTSVESTLTEQIAFIQSYKVEIRYPNDEGKNEILQVETSSQLDEARDYFLEEFLPNHVTSKQKYPVEIHCLNGHRSSDWTPANWIFQYIVCSRQNNVIQHEVYCNVYYISDPEPDRNCACTIC